MNNQARRRIQVSLGHYLYQSNRHLENNDYTAYDRTRHYYDVNTQIATVRCFCQNIMQTTVGADLMNIHVIYTEDLVR